MTFPIEASMKRDWRKISVLMWTSAGREEPISASSRSSLRVSSRELVLGCLVTVRRTAGLPSFEAYSQNGGLGSDFDVGNGFQRNRQTPGCRFDHGLLQRADVPGSQDPPYNILVSILVKGPAGGIPVHVLDGIDNLVQRYAVMPHAAGIQQDLVFFDIASDNRYLGYAAGRKQARTKGPVGQRPQVLHGSGVCGKADDHQLSQNGRLRTQGGVSYIGGKRFSHHRDFLAHNLPRAINIGPPVEFDVDDGKAGGR